MADTLTIPNTEGDITREWIKQSTGYVAKEGSILVSGNIQEGLGYLSNLCRVSFICEKDGNRKSFLVKLPPKSSVFMEFAIEQKVDQREIQFYSIMKPELLKIAPELGENLCQYYCSKIIEAKDRQDYNSMLVFEDLKMICYENLDQESPNWKENLEKIMTFCAKFHASGLAIEAARKRKISQIFPFCMGAEENENLKTLLDVGAPNFTRIADLLTERKCPEHIINAYNQLSPLWEDMLPKILLKGGAFPCISHGDLWWSNIMVNKDKPNSPVKIIDWQLLSYRDPTFDIIPGILLGLPIQECNEKNVNYFSKYYFKEFVAACKKYGFEYKDRTEKEFQEFFETWGMAFGYVWMLWSVEICKTDQKKELMKTILQFMFERYHVPDFIIKHCST